VSGIWSPGCLHNMQPLKIPDLLANNCRLPLSLVIIVLFSIQSFGQNPGNWKLEKMPADLETDFALSALPPHLRDGATVYLLDPEKGYYIARKGTNGFSAFVNRTEWEWAEFAQDDYAPISYDEEGTKIVMPVFLDVAAMRASGKYSPSEIKEFVIKGVKDGKYKAPSRTGVSYMLSPLLRVHPGLQGKEIVNMVMPHYMFYAPRVDNKDIGGVWDGHGPFALTSGDIFDKEHSIFNLIIIPAGDTEKAAIVEENKALLQRLAEYKPYLKIDPTASNHQH